MVIVVSQSGETADSLAALRLAKERDSTLGIVNVVGSQSPERRITSSIPGQVEIAVASTKLGYSTQLIAHHLLAVKFAFVRGMISREEMSGYIREMKELPAQIEMLLAGKEKDPEIRKPLYCGQGCLFHGTGLDYAVSP